MLNPKKWLQSANGWRRLWFVSSVLLLLYTALIYPFVATSDTAQSSLEYRFSVKRDFENPDYKQYWAEPMSELTEPSYKSGGGACWHIYSHRKYTPQKPPLTFDDYEAHYRREQWTKLLIVSGISSTRVLGSDQAKFMYSLDYLPNKRCFLALEPHFPC